MWCILFADDTVLIDETHVELIIGWKFKDKPWNLKVLS